MIKHAAEILKLASIKEEYLKDVQNRQYSSFNRDANKKEINSFGEGFAAGAALPALLSIASSGMLNPNTHAKANKFKERIYHGSLAFQQAGMSPPQAKELAQALDIAMTRTGVKGPSGQSLGKNLQTGIKSMLVQQISGSAPLTKGVKDLTGDTTFLGFNTGSETIEQFRKGMERANIDAKGRVQVADAFAETVMNRHFPEVVKNKMSVMTDQQYSDLLDIGKGIAKLKNKPFSARKATVKRLGRFAKGNAITPLVIGLVGGSAAVANTRSKKKYKKSLERRSNAKR